MAELEVETLVQSAQTIGGDRLVDLRLLKPGIAIGLWKVNISRQDRHFKRNQRLDCTTKRQISVFFFFFFFLDFEHKLWLSLQGQSSVAFVMFTLHFLSLVESSTEGSWGR